MSGNAYQVLCLACGVVYNADCGHRCKNPEGYFNTQHADAQAIIARLTAALQLISECTQCCGPECMYCEGEIAHPSSTEAIFAREALANLAVKL